MRISPTFIWAPVWDTNVLLSEDELRYIVYNHNLS